MVRCNSEQDIELVYNMRYQVFVKELGFEQSQIEKECDDEDPRSDHYLIYCDKGFPVGCFRLIKGCSEKSQKIIKEDIIPNGVEFSRFIILREYRARENVSKVFDAVEEIMLTLGHDKFYAAMELKLYIALRRSGFKLRKVSDTFELNGPRAIYMITERPNAKFDKATILDNAC